MSLEDISFEARDELALLAKRLSDSPDTRGDFLRLAKKVNPDLPIPELDIQDRTNSAVQKAEQRVASLEARLKERDAHAELERRRQALLKKGLIENEDQIKEVEKVMLEKGVTNHETAAEYWNWMRQAAQPTPVTNYQPGVMQKFDLSNFMKNPVQGARNEAFKALTELRKRPIGL